MKVSSVVVLLFFSVSSAHSAKEGQAKKGTATTTNEPKSSRGLCVVGCTPYINPYDETAGVRKWNALVQEMAENCDIMVHVGDTKAGGAVCDRDLMVSFRTTSSQQLTPVCLSVEIISTDCCCIP